MLNKSALLAHCINRQDPIQSSGTSRAHTYRDGCPVQSGHDRKMARILLGGEHRQSNEHLLHTPDNNPKV